MKNWAKQVLFCPFLILHGRHKSGAVPEKKTKGLQKNLAACFFPVNYKPNPGCGKFSRCHPAGHDALLLQRFPR